MKESRIVVRVPEHERDLFLQICRDHDTTVSQEIRKFIRGKLKEEAQLTLYKSASAQK